MRVCFFARVPSPDILATVNFYAQDIRALRELGHEVVPCSRFKDIPKDCDLYFVWWWSWAFLPYLRARMGRKPMVVTGVFDYNTQPLDGGAYIGRPWWKRLVLRTMLRRATANVFISRYEFDLMDRRFRPPNPFYVPCSVDVDKYVPAAVPKEPFLLNVAWSGSINARRKCLREIVESLAIVRRTFPSIRLIMAGRQGEFHPVLVATAQRLGLSDAVDFVGVITETEKIRLMQRCAVYLQPTLGEGFGLATAEAMACGAAVVTNAAGAVAEVVGSGGVLVARADPQDVASATIKLLQNPQAVADLAKRARAKIVADYPYSMRRDGLARVIASVTSTHPPGETATSQRTTTSEPESSTPVPGGAHSDDKSASY